MALNNVVLSGRLTADPAGRTYDGDKCVCQFTLAVDKEGKDRGANFIDCVAWQKTADLIMRYVKRGQMLEIVGRLDQSNYEKDGQKRSRVQVVVDRVNFVSSGKPATETTEKPTETTETVKEEPQELSLDEIPF